MPSDGDQNSPTHNGTIHAVAGLLSGALTAFFVAPLDITKTRQQVSRHKSHASSTIKQIIKNEGIFGLWHGLGPTLVGLTPNWGIYWWSYNQLKVIFQTSFFKHNPDSPFVHLFSAFGAGSLTSIATNPIWVVKVRIQTQNMEVNGYKYKGILDCFRTIYLEEGLYGFTRGLVPSLIGISHVCVQFPLYEHMKLYFANRDNKSTKDLTVWEFMIASSISKIAAGVVAYPHEVLRSRQQHDRTTGKRQGIWSLLKITAKEEGFKGFYRGMGTNLLRSIPSCIITFVSFEYISKYLSMRYSK